PGPQNSGMVYASGLVASPMARTDVARSLIEPSNSATAEPNAVRCLTCLGPNAPLGTLSIRSRFTNNSNQTLTQLRFRVSDITTLNSPGSTAENSQAALPQITSTDAPTTPPTSIGATTSTVTTLHEPHN